MSYINSNHRYISMIESYFHVFITKLVIGNTCICVYQFVTDKYLQNKIEMFHFFIMYVLVIFLNLNYHMEYMFYGYKSYYCAVIPFVFMGDEYYLSFENDTKLFSWSYS